MGDHITADERVAFATAALEATPAFEITMSTPPKALTDRQFWDLSKDSSEEDGVFRSDNLLSNETSFQYVIPDLLGTVKQGRAYLGVGPEQNFTYISAFRPTMAIIIDIRHGNLDVLGAPPDPHAGWIKLGDGANIEGAEPWVRDHRESPLVVVRARAVRPDDRQLPVVHHVRVQGDDRAAVRDRSGRLGGRPKRR
jgi:hypothetical protein